MAWNRPSPIIDASRRVREVEDGVSQLLSPRSAGLAISAIAMAFAFTVAAQEPAAGLAPASRYVAADGGAAAVVAVSPSTDLADAGPSVASAGASSNAGVERGAIAASIPTFRPHAPPLPPPGH